MQICHDFTLKTFNPNTNDFDSEVKTVWREADRITVKRLKIFNTIRAICLWLLLPVLLGTLTCGVCIGEVSLWFLFGFFGGLFLLGFCICYTADMENQEDRIYEDFRDNNFDDEKAKCATYNAEQEQIALEWRKAHPFEEKIRMAKTRGSSVDIAEMVKEYIKLQKGE